MRPADNQPPPSRRLTVQEAATALGVTVDAVRGRIKRGSLESSKGKDGTVYVLVGDYDQPADQADGQPGLAADQSRLVEALQDQIEHLRRQLDEANRANAEHRRLLAAALERIPEIEAPQEPSDGPETAAETSGKGGVPPEPQRRSERPWWRRVFGSE
jgi:hypothetical protein